MSPRILVVDDDGEMAEMVGDYLTSAGYRVDIAVGGKAAIAVLKRREVDAVLTDLRMNDVDGLDVLAAARARDATLPVLIMTAYGTIEGGIEAVRRGAFHYLTKPFRLEEVGLHLDRALAARGLARENQQLRRAVEERYGFRNLIGKSSIMIQLYDLLERVSATKAPALIVGESGTGKELVARALHFGSPRGRAPLVAVNCAALAGTLLESELFGHARGAFTGAVEQSRGLFVEADGGTLFLDEIGEMPLELQAKLLRALETGSVRAVGSSTERKVDVRIVAATNRDLARAVAERTFREDLYYRLNVIPIQVPPLRARREDIPLLIEHFVTQHAQRLAEQNPDATAPVIAPDAVRRLTEYPWPGNVRELKNAVERLLLLARGPRIDVRDLSRIVPSSLPEAMAPLQAEIVPLRVMTRRYIEWVLTQTGGSKARTAQLLEIDASTIYRMLAKDDE